MIKNFGELANDLRLCTSVELNDTTSADLWIDEIWRKTSLTYLDVKRYNEWIAPQKVGDKPWLMAFGITPYSQPQSQQTTNHMIVKLMCLSKVYGDDFNYGFADYKKGEFIFESYDYE